FFLGIGRGSRQRDRQQRSSDQMQKPVPHSLIPSLWCDFVDDLVQPGFYSARRHRWDGIVAERLLQCKVERCRKAERIQSTKVGVNPKRDRRSGAAPVLSPSLDERRT